MTQEETWSEKDYADASCMASQVGMPKDLSTWCLGDYRDGLCPLTSVGKPKVQPEPAAPPKEPEVEGDYGSKLGALGEAALDVVLSHPGGPHQWFKENPSAHTKLLVKLATPIQQGADATVNVNISWLSPDRLSYKHSGAVQEAAEDVVPRALPSVAGWKEPAEPVIGLNTLLHDALNPSNSGTKS